MPRVNSNTKELLSKSREAAILAVDIYNKPATKFRSYGYIVLMTIAWTSLFHAIFESKKIKYYYKEPKDKRKYVVVDGEKKAWELGECLKEFYKNQTSPVKANLEIIIGVRNKIEHRFLPVLDLALIGECHAMLLNYENLLTTEFGNEFSLNASLAIPIQLMSVNPAWQAEALKQLQSREYKVVREYLDAFRASLQEDILNSQEFSFRVYLIPKTANREPSSDLAIEFVKYDPADTEAMKRYEHLVTLIKEKHIRVPVANLDVLRAGDVCKRIQQALRIRFSPSGQHVKCWKHYAIRPSTHDENPERTTEKYCHYDMAHKDYLYTEEWVAFLLEELGNPEKQMLVFGRHL